MVRSVTLPETYHAVPDYIHDINGLNTVLSVETESKNASHAAIDTLFYNKCYYIAYHILAYTGRKMRFTLYTDNGYRMLDIATSDFGYTFQVLDDKLQTLSPIFDYPSNTDGFYSPQIVFSDLLRDLCNIFACYDIGPALVLKEGRNIEEVFDNPDPYTLSERGDEDIQNEERGGCTIL